ncbi:MAG: hypothetical protein HFG42_13945 [Lachnospiraceae bacterium]|jgi:hypothetical protein|nr:hypothetical protein [Lachnospiraceae bacterium]
MESIRQFINDRGITFQILFYGFLFAYGYNIVTNLFHLFQIWKGIIRLSGFINAYSQHRSVKRKRKLLLRYFPIISRYLGPHSDKLNYGDNDFNIHYKSVSMLDDLLMKRNFQTHRFRASFNPFLGIKTFVTLPMVILSWFGIRPNIKHEPTINIIGLAVEVLLAKILESHYTQLESFAKSICDIIRGIWSNIP